MISHNGCFHHEDRHINWASHCVENFKSKADKVNTIPIYQRKQGSERIIYLARSKGINSQNSNPKVKPQTPISRNHGTAWPDGLRKNPDVRPRHGPEPQWGVGSKLTHGFHSSRQQDIISPVPTELLLWGQRVNGRRGCLACMTVMVKFPSVLKLPHLSLNVAECPPYFQTTGLSELKRWAVCVPCRSRLKIA
jgi:hypothetical protein